MARLRQSRRHSDPTPIENLLEQIREHLFLPDPGAFYTVIGTLAANMLQGVPVWSMLVGPPSAGGTELINLISDLPQVFEAGPVEGYAAFLSGTSDKDKTNKSTGGLLKLVGAHGLLTFKDFTEILALSTEKRNTVLG